MEAVKMALLPTETADAGIQLEANLKSKFLTGLAPAELKIVLAAAQRRRLSANQVMLQAGPEPATHFYLLLTGRAKYCMVTADGQELMLRWLHPGDVFGLGTLTPVRGPNFMSVEAARESTALIWD